MAWENLSEDIAEEFSDNRQLGWVEGFSVIQRALPRAPRLRATPNPQRHRGDHAKWARLARGLGLLTKGGASGERQGGDDGGEGGFHRRTIPGRILTGYLDATSTYCYL